jgi:hypothetical protein
VATNGDGKRIIKPSPKINFTKDQFAKLQKAAEELSEKHKKQEPENIEFIRAKIKEKLGANLSSGGYKSVANTIDLKPHQRDMPIYDTRPNQSCMPLAANPLQPLTDIKLTTQEVA